MCFRSGGGDPGAAARAEEAARQARIRAGMSQVDALFGGGRYGTGATSQFTPEAKYYTSDGQEWTPDPTDYYQTRSVRNLNVRGGIGTEKYLPENWQYKAFQKQTETAPLYTGFAESKGFGDDFYKDRSSAYSDYALPQVDDQYKRAYDSVIQNLARSGNLRSSAGAKQLGMLQRELGTARQRVADEGMRLSNELRGQVEQNRSDVINQLNATGDAQIAANSALSRAAMLRQPTSFEPLGNLFGGVTETLAMNRMANAYDPSVPRFTPSLKLFGSNKSSRVVN